ncbi:MAG TPA: agmatine deiminase family protein [Solirubrobacteraceae bacterium]
MLRMPPEWAPHERTLMGWPCRRRLWGDALAQAKAEYAGVANAIAAFEPVTMVCGSPADAAEARAALSAACEIVELPLDDSWLRDCGPIFVTGDGRRAGVHFAFNAWGEKFDPYDKDAAVGATLVERFGDELISVELVLEGGSIANDGAGALLTTEQCLLHPNRNPTRTREEIEATVLGALGLERMVWLGNGLVEDRDTDGHVDLICVPIAPGRVLLQSAPAGDANHAAMVENAARCAAAGIEVEAFEPLARTNVATLSYLNLYLCNGAAIVPLAGTAEDTRALERLREVLPDRELVGVPALTIAAGGGGPHCITQQVPRA